MIRPPIIDILEQVLGESKYTYNSNYAFHCPTCNHHKPKLEVNVVTGRWRCWICTTSMMGSRIVDLLHRITASDVLIRAATTIIGDHIDDLPETKHSPVKLPTEYISCDTTEDDSFAHIACMNFLEQRGVRPIDIVRYDIGYCKSGKYSDMLIIPNYTATGGLNYFTTRTFMPIYRDKFKNVNASKDVIGFEMQLNFDLPLIIVEAALDAIAVRFNATPKYGKTMSSKLRRRLLTIPEVIFCPDPDAITDAIADVKYTTALGIPTKLVILPDGEDASSLGHDNVWEFIDKAEYVTERSLLEFQLKYR